MPLHGPSVTPPPPGSWARRARRIEYSIHLARPEVSRGTLDEIEEAERKRDNRPVLWWAVLFGAVAAFQAIVGFALVFVVTPSYGVPLQWGVAIGVWSVGVLFAYLSVRTASTATSRQ